MNKACIVITRGAEGLLYKGPQGEGELAAFPAKAVDTSGAGDIFHGAFAYCLYWEMDWEESLIFSSLATSHSVRCLGGRTSTPELHGVVADFEKFYGGFPGEDEG